MNKKYKIGKSILKSKKGLVLVVGISVLLLLTVTVSASMLLNKPVEESPKQTTTETTSDESVKPSSEKQTESSEGEVKKESPKQSSSPTTSTQAPTSTTPSTPPKAVVSCSEAYREGKSRYMFAVRDLGIANINYDMTGYNASKKGILAPDDPARTVYRNSLVGFENKTIELKLIEVNADLAKYNCTPLPNVYSIAYT